MSAKIVDLLCIFLWVAWLVEGSVQIVLAKYFWKNSIIKKLEFFRSPVLRSDIVLSPVLNSGSCSCTKQDKH